MVLSIGNYYCHILTACKLLIICLSLATADSTLLSLPCIEKTLSSNRLSNFPFEKKVYIIVKLLYKCRFCKSKTILK